MAPKIAEWVFVIAICGWIVYGSFAVVRQWWRDWNRKREGKGERPHSFAEYTFWMVVYACVWGIPLAGLSWVVVWLRTQRITLSGLAIASGWYIGKIALYALGVWVALKMLQYLVQFIAVTWTDAVDQRRRERD